MMKDFWSSVGQLEKSEADIAAAAAWHFFKTGQRVPTLSEICDSIEHHGVRLNINRSRLRARLKKYTGASISGNGELRISQSKQAELSTRYVGISDFPVEPVQDTVLSSKLFSGDRPYVRELVRQINASRQQNILDGCAVLMRRLMEVSIIDAFEAKNSLNSIIDGAGNFYSLQALVSTVSSGSPIRLSRGSSKVMDECKLIGDRAAHSRTYRTTELDIDSFAPKYRGLIAELRAE